MAKKIINAQMKQRRDTKANWAANNPVLLAGELGIVSDDPNLYKVGDGATAWNALPFRGFDGTLVHTTGDSDTAVMSQKAVTEKLTELSAEFGIIEGHYVGDVDIFTKDIIPAGNTINIYFTLQTTAGAIRVLDAEGNTLRAFDAENLNIGANKEWKNYVLPNNYNKVVNVGGYSGSYGLDVKIETLGLNLFDIKNNIENINSEVSGIVKEVAKIPQIEGVKVGVLDMLIYSNSAWDTNNGNIVSVEGYTRTDKSVYNSLATISVMGFTMLCWNKDIYQGSVYNNTISPYEGTTHVAFYWNSIVNKVIYTSLLYNAKDYVTYNDIQNIESQLKSLSLVFEGKETNYNGNYKDNQNTAATLKIAVKKGDIITTSLPIYTIAKYDGQGLFIGENTEVRHKNMYSVEEDVAFIIITFLIQNKDAEISINDKRIVLADFIYESQQGNSTQINDSAIEGVSLNGKRAKVVNRIAEIPLASTSNAGLMSAEDKQKLDNFQAGNITIEGSGVTKNASAYGFLPTNDGETNAANLQSCLNGGGTIIIDLPGTYSISRTLLVDSNTEINIGKNVFFKKEADKNGIYGRHTFLNRGALTRTYNENITIKGLHVITQELGTGTDVPNIIGLRGEIAMFYIKKLHIDGFTCLDGNKLNYNIHVCTFEDIIIENVHIEGLKDGIHLGRGRNFVLRHCKFATNDDAIALNAHDYPASNPEIGDLEDGIIEDITYLPAPLNYNTARGALMIVGSWSDWKQGNSYIPNGDTVVSNGRIYMTYGQRSTTEVISTIQPTHEDGVVTYDDGITWLMKQNVGVAYSATIRRVSFNNIFCYRNSGTLFPFYLECNEYVRCYYPNSVPPIIENVTISNVYVAEGTEISYLARFYCPIKNIVIRDSQFGIFGGLAFGIGQAGNTTALVPVENYEGNILVSGAKLRVETFAYTEPNSRWNIRMKTYGTLCDSDISPIIRGNGITLLSNDL